MIPAPGITRSGLQIQSSVGPHPEMPLQASRRSLDPTVITLRLLPGAVTDPGEGPMLPAAVTTISPLSHASSTARISMDAVFAEFPVAPMEILIIRILYFAFRLHIHWRASTTFFAMPFPCLSSIFAQIR